MMNRPNLLSTHRTVTLFDEPNIEFRHGQVTKDPRHGLALFGPYDADEQSKPSMGYIVIGTDEGIERFNSWAQEMENPTTGAPRDNQRLWVPYPGFEASFGSRFPSTAIRSFHIDRESILAASRRGDPHERAYEAVQFYLDGLQRAWKLDEQIGFGVCVVPDEVWKNCRTKSRVTNATRDGISKRQKRLRRLGQLEMFDDFDVDQYWHSTDFRRQLKARAMEYNIPIQIVLESTLSLSDGDRSIRRGLTPLSDRKWNLSTALYYKSGGKPWRLMSAREGVCYIGIAFRRENEGRTACCAAQMFLDSGDGIVFLGEYGPWFSPKTGQFTLNGEAAQKLLTGVLQTYRDLMGKDLTEVFLHKRSIISDEEFAGFQKACSDHVHLVGVRVRNVGRGGFRLFRVGNMPVIRGTFLKLNSSSGLLWGSGYKPDIGTYRGTEVPVPLRIEIQHGEAQIERVAQDILGLTKLNYNACRIGDAEPVTIGFSNKVGEILISNPRVEYRRPNFKFYI